MATVSANYVDYMRRPGLFFRFSYFVGRITIFSALSFHSHYLNSLRSNWTSTVVIYGLLFIHFPFINNKMPTKNNLLLLVCALECYIQKEQTLTSKIKKKEQKTTMESPFLLVLHLVIFIECVLCKWIKDNRIKNNK